MTLFSGDERSLALKGLHSSPAARSRLLCIQPEVSSLARPSSLEPSRPYNAYNSKRSPGSSRAASIEIGQAPAIFPARPRFSRVHDQPCDDSPSPDHRYPMQERLLSKYAATPLLRSPLVNPRRSRRYATDFGLGRRPDALTRVGTPFEDVLGVVSIGSNPSTIEEASDSDDLSSIYGCAAADFPQPPPIGSPVIRRMRSSPWFGAQMLDVNHSSVSREYTSSGTPLGTVSPCPPAMSTSQKAVRVGPKASSVLKANEHTLSTVGLDSARTETGTLELVGDSPVLGVVMNLFSPLPLDISFAGARITTDCNERSTSHRNHPFSREIYQQPKSILPQPQRTHDARVVSEFLGHKRQRDSAHGQLPRIIRKVASMRSDTQRMDLSGHRNSEQRPVPKSRSFRSIPHASETGQSFKSSHNGDKLSFLFHGSQDISLKNSHPPVSFLPDAKPRSKRDKERVRCHLSAPFTRAQSVEPLMVSPFSGSLSAPTGLRCSCCNHGFRTRCSCKLTQSRSFVDITSEDDGRHESKGGGRRKRMKEFISKATGILRWGKQQKLKN